jgi:hypothetical protein
LTLDIYDKLTLKIVESTNRIVANQMVQPRDAVRDSEIAIRHSQLLADGFENEALASPADQRDRLLNAARTVAKVYIVLTIYENYKIMINFRLQAI